MNLPHERMTDVQSANPGSNPANPFYYRTIEEQRLQEAVTVELQFKKDADGKKAGGKKVRLQNDFQE